MLTGRDVLYRTHCRWYPSQFSRPSKGLQRPGIFYSTSQHNRCLIRKYSHSTHSHRMSFLCHRMATTLFPCLPISRRVVRPTEGSSVRQFYRGRWRFRQRRPPICYEVDSKYVGFRTALRTWAVISVTLTTPALCFMKARIPHHHAHAGLVKIDLKFFKSPGLWILLFGNIIQSLRYFMPTFYMPCTL